ncbi:legumain-like isoform X3, partial [Aphis craccivora]
KVIVLMFIEQLKNIIIIPRYSRGLRSNEVARILNVKKEVSILNSLTVAPMGEIYPPYPPNPYRGELFNHPNGSDVYQGVQVDYKGEWRVQHKIIE